LLSLFAGVSVGFSVAGKAVSVAVAVAVAVLVRVGVGGADGVVLTVISGEQAVDRGGIQAVEDVLEEPAHEALVVLDGHPAPTPRIHRPHVTGRVLDY
jgi:hypothetical protein